MSQLLHDLTAARERMIERHIAGRGLTDPLLLDAFRAVPRELFVAEQDAAFAYDDGPLPIPAEQTISQPYIVALMINRARIRPGDRVLEVGAGSGYAAAVISRIAGQVIAVERHEELARLAAGRMARLAYQNVRIVHGDGALGCPDEAPFDAIILSAAATEVPPALPMQLRRGGTLIMPLGPQSEVQQLIGLRREEGGGFTREELGGVRFVPLVTNEGETS